MNMLKAKRLSLKLTREEVSKKTNISTSTIRSMESGRHQTTFKNLVTYTKFLGINLDDYAKEYLNKMR